MPKTSINGQTDPTAVAIPGRGRHRRAVDFTALLLMAVLFFTYFSLITESEYWYFPKGDASTYTLMVLHLDEPEKIEEKLPAIYSQRIVPPLITYLLGYRQFSAIGGSADHVTTIAKTKKVAAIPFNQVVWVYWNTSNFIAYSLQLFFIFLTLSYIKVERITTFFLLAIYSTWFLSLRLYINWVQMPDPWAFAFLAAATYYTIKRNTPGFLISILLGSMCKEILLLMLPTYIWRRATAKDNLSRRLSACVAAGALPLILFFWLRGHPYFPSEILTPNSLTTPDAPSWSRLLPRLSDYIYLLYYHYSYRIKLGPIYLLDILLIPVGTFAGLSTLLLWSAKETGRTLKEHAYWLPFIALTAVVGISVDRYIFHIFPVVLLISGLVLEKRFSGRYQLYALIVITAVAVTSNDLLIPSSASNMSYKHQLELTSMISPKLAWTYRTLIIWTTLLGVTGLFLINRVSKKGRSGV